ncbi:MAG TPA: hypothetical protein VML54_06120 [Candidatus Limnocylindrales bacterium]|nr:hypothetical protein [Candidatus Limnocylindrales bacterium]
MARKPVKKATTRKRSLSVRDLPSKAGGKVTGGFVSKRIMKTSDCNSNTLTCKDTSTTNTLCCE